MQSRDVCRCFIRDTLNELQSRFCFSRWQIENWIWLEWRNLQHDKSLTVILEKNINKQISQLCESHQHVRKRSQSGPVTVVLTFSLNTKGCNGSKTAFRPSRPCDAASSLAASRLFTLELDGDAPAAPEAICS